MHYGGCWDDPPALMPADRPFDIDLHLNGTVPVRQRTGATDRRFRQRPDATDNRDVVAAHFHNVQLLHCGAAGQGTEQQ